MSANPPGCMPKSHLPIFLINNKVDFYHCLNSVCLSIDLLKNRLRKINGLYMEQPRIVFDGKNREEAFLMCIKDAN